jgi:hypothetical protein
MPGNWRAFLFFVVRRQSAAATALSDAVEIFRTSQSGVAATLCHRTTKALRRRPQHRRVLRFLF